MEFKEITAKTVDEAITKACLEFETSSDNLEIQVVQEGTSGFLGFIGSKPAVIKVRKKVQEEEFDILKELAKEEKKEKKAPVKEEKKEPKKEIKKETKPVKEPKKGTVPKTQTENKEEKPVAKEAQPKPEPRKPVVRTEEQVQQMKQDAEKFLTGVFGAMELPVEITMNYDKTADCLEIDFAGEDMGILIGKRGQTLDSLQYIISLVVNKESDSYIRIKVDTENYRERRKATLENLAKNLAYKVKRTRRPVSLEPMNPYERRVIHSVLQNDRYVETHSEGEEPYRKVVITLKKDYRERSPRSGYNREGRYNRENNYNRERGYRRERSYSREEVERPAENNENNDSNDNV